MESKQNKIANILHRDMISGLFAAKLESKNQLFSENVKTLSLTSPGAEEVNQSLCIFF